MGAAVDAFRDILRVEFSEHHLPRPGIIGGCTAPGRTVPVYSPDRDAWQNPTPSKKHKMFIFYPNFIQISFIFRPSKSKYSYHKSISRLTTSKWRCYNTPTLGPAARRSQATNYKLFTLNFGGIYIMKNIFVKNLVKSMAEYGEYLNRVGC